MEKLDYWSPVNFLSLLQNTLTYSCLTDTKLHVHVVNTTHKRSVKQASISMNQLISIKSFLQMNLGPVKIKKPTNISQSEQIENGYF